MIQNYKSLDALWCDWGTAIDALMKYKDENEPLQKNMHPWEFEMAYVVTRQQGEYDISAIFNSYNSYTNKQVLLSLKVEVMNRDEIFVFTVKRE
ncbi:MAG: hypothetical protein COA66_02365 [Arcobacter sp.]|nr:MAG: hypothetical protein COA66_02365 [Arcobacter sp.]